MKTGSWDDYKWFLLGLAIMGSKYLWEGNGESNKNLRIKLSDNGIASITYDTVEDE